MSDGIAKIKQKLQDTVENNASDDNVMIRKDGDDKFIVGNASLKQPEPKVKQYSFLLVKEFNSEPTEAGWQEVKSSNGVYKKLLVSEATKIPVALLPQIQSLLLPITYIINDGIGNDNGGIDQIKMKSGSNVVNLISEIIGNYAGSLRKLASILTGYDESVFLDWYMVDYEHIDKLYEGNAFDFIMALLDNNPNIFEKLNLS